MQDGQFDKEVVVEPALERLVGDGHVEPVLLRIEFAKRVGTQEPRGEE